VKEKEKQTNKQTKTKAKITTIKSLAYGCYA